MKPQRSLDFWGFTYSIVSFGSAIRMVQIDLLVKEGDTIPTIVDSTQRKGSILFAANDMKHMYEVAEKICDNITFVYQDLSEWKPSFKKYM